MSINVLHNYQHAPKTTDLYATWATSPHAEFYTKRGFKPTLRREKDSRLVSPEGSIWFYVISIKLTEKILLYTAYLTMLALV